jgi:hypothetical protein
MSSSRDNLKPDAFYWVLVAPPGGEFSEVPEWQPARHIGQSGDADGRLVWEVLGENRTDYHHRVDVVDFGPEIVRPERGCL